jgi:hypothetical protein
MLQAPAKYGATSSTACKKIGRQDRHSLAADFVSGGCNVTPFCFVFNSGAMPSQAINKNDGIYAQTALLH